MAVELLERGAIWTGSSGREGASGPGCSPSCCTTRVACGRTPARSYAALVAASGRSEGALRVAVHRLRGRWRQCLLEVVARQASRPQDIEAERLLRSAFRAPASDLLGTQGQRREAREQEIVRHLPDLELPGEGGMGTVWGARQRRLGRAVALEVLSSPDPGSGSIERDGEQAAVRFEREARALAQLAHPCIVSIYDYESAFCWLMLEYVEGETLRDVMDSGWLRPPLAIALVEALCDALHYAHGQGIVLRDIKPENVLIERRGQVKVTDFGLAKILIESAALVSLTHPRQVLGTLCYMAPEQLDRLRDVDHRADLDFFWRARRGVL